MVATETAKDEPRIRLFISYANRDRAALDLLALHLRPIVELGVDLFYDALLRPGPNLPAELMRHLESANVVLFLVSENWLASDVCQRELQVCLSRAEDKLLTPIILTRCDWSGSPLARFVALPSDGVPVALKKSPAVAYSEVVLELTRSIIAFQQRGKTREGDALAERGTHRHDGRIGRVIVSPDGGVAVSSSAECVLAWDTVAMRQLGWAPVDALNGGEIADVSMQPNKDLLVAVRGKRSLAICELTSNSTTTWRELARFPWTGYSDIVSLSNDAVATQWHEDETFYAVHSAGRWRSSVLKGAPASALCVAGTLLVRSVGVGECEWWDLQSAPLLLARLKVAMEPIRYIAISASLNMYCAGCDSGAIQVFERGRVYRELKASKAPVEAIVPLKDGQHALVACREGLRLFNLRDGLLVREKSLGDDYPTAIAVTSDERRVIFGTARGNLSAWPIDVTPRQTIPQGRDRLRLAYLAVLERPELWRLLETLDEGALAGLGAQLGVPAAEEPLAYLDARHPGKEPPALWAAWMETLHSGLLGVDKA